MGKQSTIISSTFPNSSPSLSRSEIIHSTLSNLDHTDSITRCSIKSVTIAKNNTIKNNIEDAPEPGPSSRSRSRSSSNFSTSTSPSTGIHLKRCKITTSTLSNTSLRRCKIAHSTLTNIPSAHRTDVSRSTLDDVSSLRRVSVSNSTVADGSALSRCKAKDSVVSSSAVYRGSIEKSNVVGSRLRKTKLKECDVKDCVIVNTDFRGMVLRNGVWKDGVLVGCFRGMENVVVNGKMMDMPVKSGDGSKGKKNEVPEKWMEGMEDSEMESSGSDSDSETEEDLPPPYTP